MKKSERILTALENALMEEKIEYCYLDEEEEMNAKIVSFRRGVIFGLKLAIRKAKKELDK